MPEKPKKEKKDAVMISLLFPGLIKCAGDRDSIPGICSAD